MHRATRVLLCRLGFVVLCLLPTLGVSGWIISRSWGGGAARKAAWERELTSRLGLVVDVAEVSYPGPHTARLDDVRLLNPETLRLVAAARTIEVTRAASGWLVESSPAKLELAELGQVARAIEERLLRGPMASRTSVEWSPCEITLTSGQPLTLRGVSGQYAADALKAELMIAFHLPEAADPIQGAKLQAIRRRGPTPATTWQLDTGGTPLPCHLASGLLPGVNCLGNECLFAGRAVVMDSAAGQGGTLAGEFLAVDLDALVTERFPHRLSGRATLRIDQAVLDRGKLVELRGRLEAKGGAIGPPLLAAAQEHLQLSVLAGAADASPGAAIPLDQLSFGFHLAGDALSISGDADSQQGGIVMSGPAGPLLLAPLNHAVPAVSLLRTLLPAREFQVPATRQTAALIDLLPVPDLDVSRETPYAAEHTPTRLAPTAAASTAAPLRQPKVR